jgi:hypothetical protein
VKGFGGKPPPPAPPSVSDGMDKSARSSIEKTLARPKTQPSEPLETPYRVVSAGDLAPEHGRKDAERLRILTRSPLYLQEEKRWLVTLGAKLQLHSNAAVRKLGHGLWKKKYPDKHALAAALHAHVSPIFGKVWGVSFEAPEALDDERFFLAWPDIEGEPALHPAYVDDARAYDFVIHQDDTKHVCHGYVMALCHVWFRALLAQKRKEGADFALSRATGFSRAQLHAMEVNLVQHYVPSSESAYFEGQPLRSSAREVANLFRKLAFGGQ